MFRKITVLTVLAVLLAALLAPAFAEETAEYTGELFAFRYPASWNRIVLDDGRLVLEAPEGHGVLAYAIQSGADLFTGDAAADAEQAERMIRGNMVENLTLNGSYELTAACGLYGYRAYGSWGGQMDAVQVVLAGEGRVIVFVLVGANAINAEAALISTLWLPDRAPAAAPTAVPAEAAGTDGWPVWEEAMFRVAYPAGFEPSSEEVLTLFTRGGDPDSLIMAAANDLGADHTDELGLTYAKDMFRSVTGNEAEAVIERIGRWNAAVVRGTSPMGPMELYMLGSGQREVVLLFTGDCIQYAPDVVASLEIR